MADKIRANCKHGSCWDCETPEAMLTKNRNYPDGTAVHNRYFNKGKNRYLIRENIEVGSTIISDGLSAYDGINAMQMNYNHQFVNHRINFVDDNDVSIHTQSIEVTWSPIKRSMKKLVGTS